MDNDNTGGKDVLNALYSCCIIPPDQWSSESYTRLLYSGFVYCEKDNGPALTYDKSILVARNAHNIYELIKEFDDGAAYELLFYYLSYNRTINITYGDHSYTINGRTNTPRSKDLRATRYVVQPAIGADVEASGNHCYLIKLAKNHFAVDYLILDSSQGSAASRALYFVQVSGQHYQDREQNRKFSAVKAHTSQLSDTSPFTYYCAKFNTRNRFFVYSTPTTPLSKYFSQDKQEQNRIYFHSLRFKRPH